MVPSISAKYASLNDTIVDNSGKHYIAKMIGGEMTWVSIEKPSCPTISPDYMNVGDVLIGNDNKEYIVMMSNNKKIWTLKKSKNNNKQTSSDQSTAYPVISVENTNVGDIYVGRDGNEYIVKLIKGKKQYVVHQKIYKWSQSGVMYKTLENSNNLDCGYSPMNTNKHSRQKMSKTKKCTS